MNDPKLKKKTKKLKDTRIKNKKKLLRPQS